MRQILQQIAWKTNRWSTTISLLNIYLGGDNKRFGFRIFTIDKGITWEGSLLEVTWSFPTVTHRGELNIDFLFLFDVWDKWCIDNADRQLWGRPLSWWERVNLDLNSFLKNIG